MSYRKPVGAILTICLVLLTVGCNAVPVGFTDPAAKAEALRAFRAGEATMQCGRSLECAVYWSEARPIANRLVLAERWDDVADVVLRAGYEQDLTWFYLALAAEGVGQPQAAKVYYDNAIRRAMYGSGQSCVSAGMSNCDGVRLPEDAQKLQAANAIRAKAAGRARTAGPSPTAKTYVQNLTRIRAEQQEARAPWPISLTQTSKPEPMTHTACPANFRC